MQTRINTAARVGAVFGLVLLSTSAFAQDRSQTWEFEASLFGTESLTLSGEQSTGLDVDSDVGFGLGASYNFNNRWALGFGFSWHSPRYEATYLPEAGPPLETLRASMDIWSLQGKGTFNLLEGPITPYLEVGFGWTNVDSNIIDGPPISGCWWDPWWGYICDTFYSTYTEDLTSWYYGAGVRWDINREFGIKGSYGMLELDTSKRTEDASIGLWRVEVVWRY